MLSQNLQEVIDRFCYVVQIIQQSCIFPNKSSFYKSFCVSLITNSNRGLILLAITAEAILRSVFNKLIGLQLPIKCLSFPSFGIHVTVYDSLILKISEASRLIG